MSSISLACQCVHLSGWYTGWYAGWYEGCTVYRQPTVQPSLATLLAGSGRLMGYQLGFNTGSSIVHILPYLYYNAYMTTIEQISCPLLNYYVHWTVKLQMQFCTAITPF